MKIRFSLSPAVGRLCAAMALGFAPLIQAATPQAFNFQAIARKPDGAPIASATVKIRASIHSGSAGGTVVYQETQSASTSAGGQFSLQIGAGTVSVGSMALIPWQNANYYLQIEIDPTGGNSFVDMGTQQMVSVPYALQSHVSDLTSAVAGTQNRVPIFGASGNTVGDSNIYYNNGLIGIGAPSTSYYLDVAGTVQGQTLRSQGNAFITDDVSADRGIFATSATVGGLPVARSADSVPLRIYHRDAAFTVTSLSPGGTIQGTINYITFTSVPQVMLGSIVTGTGDYKKVILTISEPTTNSCKATFFNPGSSAITLTGTWQLICIGN